MPQDDPPQQQLRHVVLEDIEDPNENRDIGLEFDRDDRARIALEERQAGNQGNQANRVNSWKTKGVVGAKKAKSLAKREQRRTYFEYVRQQAEEQKERIRIEEQMFGDLYEEEREERQLRIEEAKLELEEMTRLRKAEEEAEKLEYQTRKSEVETEFEKTGLVKLDDDLIFNIVMDMPNVYILENEEFAIKLNDRIATQISELVKSEGHVSYDQIGETLNSLYT